MKIIILLAILFLVASCSKSGSDSGLPTGAATLQSLSVNSTDTSIQFKPTENHLYRECDSGVCTDDQVLFLFFPGSDGSPTEHAKIAEVIGKTGIRVLVLAYQNNGSLNSICGTTDGCYTDARRDRVDGAASSSYVQSTSDGVKNRLLKALQKLGWNQFYSGNSILWNRIIVGGFSQGAGVAAWIGKQNSVKRVCQFSGTWDHTVGTTAATWLSGSSATSASLFYGFTHKDDSLTNGVSYLDLNWQALGMGTGAYSLTLSGQKIYAQDTDAACVSNAHACSVADSVTPVDASGEPRYQNIWKYTCGR